MNRLTHYLGAAVCCVVLLPGAWADGRPAATAVKAGTYCPQPGTADVVLEELSLALDEVMHSEKLVDSGNLAASGLRLARASAAQGLAASRGRAARTARLIDAVITSRRSEDNVRMLGWFPMLHTAMLGLPEDPREAAAGREIAAAEDILRGDRSGDVLVHLRAAKDDLSCDNYAIPLQQADDALAALNRLLLQGEKPQPAMFDAVVAPLRRAVAAVLALSQDDGPG